jgi:4-amino-4-deoxychorismate lyase
MYPFFETIRYYNGIAAHLSFHQQRVDRTFLKYNTAPILQLNKLNIQEEAAKQQVDYSIVYKCKISYDLLGNYSISFAPYAIKNIQTFTFVDINLQEYDVKYTNRTWINDALHNATTDEVIFIKNKLIKDASYANVVLFDGVTWYTPRQPLLAGTKRALLIQENIIQERDIYIDQFNNYSRLKFINAMMLWEESPYIDLKVK